MKRFTAVALGTAAVLTVKAVLDFRAESRERDRDDEGNGDGGGGARPRIGPGPGPGSRPASTGGGGGYDPEPSFDSWARGGALVPTRPDDSTSLRARRAEPSDYEEGLVCRTDRRESTRSAGSVRVALADLPERVRPRDVAEN